MNTIIEAPNSEQYTKLNFDEDCQRIEILASKIKSIANFMKLLVFEDTSPESASVLKQTKARS